MALATRCPHCRTVFRINAEQLAAHNGMVRCGSCRQIFNAVDHLDYIDAPTPAPPPVARQAPPPMPAAPAGAAPARPAPAAAAAAASAPAAANAPAKTPALSPAVSAAATAASAPAAAAVAGAAAAAARSDLREARAEPGEARTETPKPRAPVAPAARPERRARPAPATRPRTEEPSIAVDTLFAAPPGETDADFDLPPEEDDPVFLRPAPEGRQRAARLALATACALLAPLLLLQLALLYRPVLMARIPELRPALSAACDLISCAAQWPMRPEYLAVVSSDLQRLPGTDVLEFTGVIRNRADFPMALPAVELTLTDSFDHTVGRKVFLANEYQVSGPAAAAGFLDAGADLSLRLNFLPPTATVVGFVAYPFYP